MPPKKIDPSKAKCTKLSFDSAVRFLREEGGEAATILTGFDIEAYTGAVVERWWGRLVVAVDGIQARQQMPIFLNHDPGKIVGYSTATNASGSFSVQGIFSSATESASEVKALAAEGFPWQASIGVKPLTILEVRENASMVVNGQPVQGPAEVWLESEVYETSFVALGADSNTRVSVFSEIEALPGERRAASPTTISSQERKMDLQQLKAEHPELVVALSAEIVAGITQEQLTQLNPELRITLLAAGAQAERDRIADVRSMSLPGHEALIAQMELDGTSTGADAAKAIVAAENLARKQAGEQFGKEANPPVDAVDGVGQGIKTVKREEFSKLPAATQSQLAKDGVMVVD